MTADVMLADTGAFFEPERKNWAWVAAKGGVKAE